MAYKNGLFCWKTVKEKNVEMEWDVKTLALIDNAYNVDLSFG